MGGCASRGKRGARGAALELEAGDSGAETPPMVELDGSEPWCADEAGDAGGACRGLVTAAAQLQLLCGPDADVRRGNGAWWVTHAHHAVFCTDDDDLRRAALGGLRQWQRFVQRRPALSRYPF